MSKQQQVAYWSCWRYYKDCTFGGQNFDLFLNKVLALSISDGEGAVGEKGQSPQQFVANKMNAEAFRSKELLLQFATVYDGALCFAAFNPRLHFAIAVFDDQRVPQTSVRFKEAALSLFCLNFVCDVVGQISPGTHTITD